MTGTAHWYGLDAKTRLGVKRLIGVAEPNLQTGAYTLEAADAGRAVEVSSQAPVTVTVPANLFEAGQTVVVVQTGPGAVTLAAGGGLTLNAPNGFLIANGQWSTITVRFRTPATAVLSGPLTD